MSSGDFIREILLYDNNKYSLGSSNPVYRLGGSAAKERRWKTLWSSSVRSTSRSEPVFRRPEIIMKNVVGRLLNVLGYVHANTSVKKSLDYQRKVIHFWVWRVRFIEACCFLSMKYYFLLIINNLRVDQTQYIGSEAGRKRHGDGKRYEAALSEAPQGPNQSFAGLKS